MKKLGLIMVGISFCVLLQGCPPPVVVNPPAAQPSHTTVVVPRQDLPPVYRESVPPDVGPGPNNSYEGGGGPDEVVDDPNYPRRSGGGGPGPNNSY